MYTLPSLARDGGELATSRDRREGETNGMRGGGGGVGWVGVGQGGGEGATSSGGVIKSDADLLRIHP